MNAEYRQARAGLLGLLFAELSDSETRVDELKEYLANPHGVAPARVAGESMNQRIRHAKDQISFLMANAASCRLKIEIVSASPLGAPR